MPFIFHKAKIVKNQDIPIIPLFLNALNAVGVEIKRWTRDKSSEFQLLFPGIYTQMC